MGGGSDCIQAAILAKLLEQSGKTVSCVISIRSSKPSSQDGSGNTPDKRTVENYKAQIFPGVYLISEETTGSGRFLEHIPAAEVPVYLIVDDDRVNPTLAMKIRAALNDTGGAHTVIAVDTGGDALYGTAQQDQAKATPDQDLRSLQAVSRLSDMNLFSCIIACGIDSPDNASDLLLQAQSQYYQPSDDEALFILNQYRIWQMDGTHPERFGKTSLAWQSALRGQRGYQALPLPIHVVSDRVNPWNPFVHLQESMQGMFFMQIADHLRVIM